MEVWDVPGSSEHGLPSPPRLECKGLMSRQGRGSAWAIPGLVSLLVGVPVFV